MKFNKLNKNVIAYWKVNNIIDFIITIIVFIFITSLLLIKNYLNEYVNIIIIAETIILLILLIMLFITPKLKYFWFGYVIDEEKVAFRKGIFFIKTTIIPLIKIGHISLETGPLLRKFKLSKIKISTASGSFEIEGLSPSEAEKINIFLKNKLTKKLKKS